METLDEMQIAERRRRIPHACQVFERDAQIRRVSVFIRELSEGWTFLCPKHKRGPQCLSIFHNRGSGIVGSCSSDFQSYDDQLDG